MHASDFKGDCRFKEVECHYCKKKGHIAKVCRSKARESNLKQQQQGKSRKQTHQFTLEEEDSDVPEYTMYHVPSHHTKPLQVDVTINGVDCQMEVDTGATLSIIKATYCSLWPSDRAPPLRASKAKLKTYTGEVITVEGAMDVDVAYKDQTARVNLLVVAGTGPSLMGRDWMKHLTLDWTHLHRLHSPVPH